MGMLLMDGFGDQTSVRRQHETAQLGVESHIAHACRN